MPTRALCPLPLPTSSEDFETKQFVDRAAGVGILHHPCQSQAELESAVASSGDNLDAYVTVDRRKQIVINRTLLTKKPAKQAFHGKLSKNSILAMKKQFGQLPLSTGLKLTRPPEAALVQRANDLLGFQAFAPEPDVSAGDDQATAVARRLLGKKPDLANRDLCLCGAGDLYFSLKHFASDDDLDDCFCLVPTSEKTQVLLIDRSCAEPHQAADDPYTAWRPARDAIRRVVFARSTAGQSLWDFHSDDLVRACNTDAIPKTVPVAMDTELFQAAERLARGDCPDTGVVAYYSTWAGLEKASSRLAAIRIRGHRYFNFAYLRKAYSVETAIAIREVLIAATCSLVQETTIKKAHAMKQASRLYVDFEKTTLKK